MAGSIRKREKLNAEFTLCGPRVFSTPTYEQEAAAVEKRIAQLGEEARRKSESLPTY